MYKKRLISLILVITFIASLICGCSKEKDNKEEFTPTPLIIEETDHIKTGAYKGTIIINGKGTSETCYEGVFFILVEDDKATVVATDFIREKYKDMYIGVESKND